MTTFNAYPGVVLDTDANDEHGKYHRRLLAQASNRLLTGKMNCVFEVTLEANQASTTVTDARITYQSVLSFMPMTANAAAEAPYVTEANITNGSAVISHANNAQTDRTFRIACIG